MCHMIYIWHFYSIDLVGHLASHELWHSESHSRENAMGIKKINKYSNVFRKTTNYSWKMLIIHHIFCCCCVISVFFSGFFSLNLCRIFVFGQQTRTCIGVRNIHGLSRSDALTHIHGQRQADALIVEEKYLAEVKKAKQFLYRMWKKKKNCSRRHKVNNTNATPTTAEQNIHKLKANSTEEQKISELHIVRTMCVYILYFVVANRRIWLCVRVCWSRTQIITYNKNLSVRKNLRNAP